MPTRGIIKPRKGSVIPPCQLGQWQWLFPQLLLVCFPAFRGFPLLPSQTQIPGSSQFTHVSAATLPGQFCSKSTQAPEQKLVQPPYAFVPSRLSLSCLGAAPAPPAGRTLSLHLITFAQHHPSSTGVRLNKIHALGKLTNKNNKKIFRHRQRYLEQILPHHYIMKLKRNSPSYQKTNFNLTNHHIGTTYMNRYPQGYGRAYDWNPVKMLDLRRFKEAIV